MAPRALAGGRGAAGRMAAGRLHLNWGSMIRVAACGFLIGTALLLARLRVVAVRIGLADELGGEDLAGHTFVADVLA